MKEVPGPGSLESRLALLVRETSDIVIAHRRALHEIPELGFEERATSQYLREALEKLGMKPGTGIVGTGLAVEVPGGGNGPVVMIRSDMDGLPIEEDPAHQPRSRRPGWMHACGHDGHMAICLGVAETLARAKEEGSLPGRILLLFQPAEENGCGASRIVESGFLEEMKVDFVLGLHLWSYLDRGRVIIPDGTVMASSDEFRVVLHGRGGHGALPHEANDVVLALSQLIVTLQSIVAREIDPLKPAVLSIGRIQAGKAPNVLPDRAELQGTFRAPDPQVRGEVLHRIGEKVAAIEKMFGLCAEVEFGNGYPATINHPGVAATARTAAQAVLGEAGVLSGPQTMAAEDFSIYLQKRPGAFMLLGMRDEAQGVIHPHHCPQFQVAEEVLPLGTEILLRTALRLMAEARE